MRRPDRIERLYIDFDGFFASAEQHFDPSLIGRPVGVVPLDSEATSLIAASREAKKAHGFKVGTKVREARRICPGIVIKVARPDLYVKLHHAIREAVEDVIHVTGVRSIDEMVCVLTADEAERGHEIAREIKQRLRDAFGPALTASIGLAPNELLAKLAAEMEKPDGLVMIRPEDLPGRLMGLHLREIPGIGPGMWERLSGMDIADMAALWALAPKQARAIWGNVEGERFWAGLHGYALEREETRRRMFGHGRVLAWDWRQPERQRDCARLLLVKAARRMRREGFEAGALMLWIRGEKGEAWATENRFPPLHDDRNLLAALDRLFKSGWTSGAAPRRARSLHVTLHGLTAIGAGQRDLFTTPTEQAEHDRWERLTDIADTLNARYGKSMVSFGLRHEPPGGYAGAKIAFGRIPDLADF